MGGSLTLRRDPNYKPGCLALPARSRGYLHPEVLSVVFAVPAGSPLLQHRARWHVLEGNRPECIPYSPSHPCPKPGKLTARDSGSAHTGGRHCRKGGQPLQERELPIWEDRSYWKSRTGLRNENNIFISGHTQGYCHFTHKVNK